MRIVHAVKMNRSGMHRLAENCALAEQRLGNESMLIDADDGGQWALPQVLNADLYVIHTIFPKGCQQVIEMAQGRKAKVVFVAHAIPEYTIELAIKAYEANGEAENFCDYWGVLRYWLNRADAFVTFNPRHQAIYQQMVPRERVIDCVPMGVDRAFWGAEVSPEPIVGNPVVWMSENQNRVKWAWDILVTWPWIAAEIPEIHLHCHWMPLDLQRFFVDFANTNAANYHANFSSLCFSHDRLRRLWKASHFLLSPTRYGDITLLANEANAAGVPLITYRGNEYAQYWIEEGDQRQMAEQLVAIFKGQVDARPVLKAPDLSEMGDAMLGVYRRVLGLPATQTVAPPHPPLALVMDEPGEVSVEVSA